MMTYKENLTAKEMRGMQFKHKVCAKVPIYNYNASEFFEVATLDYM